MFTPLRSQLPDPASPKAPEVGSSIEEMKGQIERLLLITEALWKILKEQHGYQDEELIKQITLIDLADGALDGRKAPSPPGKCPHCQRTLIKHRPRCLYCGELVASDPFQR
ncbi:MAG: hypothetical protein QM796_19610 [Chthoniobacteraceae bacterium]